MIRRLVVELHLLHVEGMHLLRVGVPLHLLAVVLLHRHVGAIRRRHVAAAEGRHHLKRGVAHHLQFHGRALHRHHLHLAEEVTATLPRVVDTLHVVGMTLHAVERVLHVGGMIRHLAVLRAMILPAVDLTVTTHHHPIDRHVMIHHLHLRAAAPPVLILHLSVVEATIQHPEEPALAVNPRPIGLEMNVLVEQRTCLLVEGMSHLNVGGETLRLIGAAIPRLAAVTTRHPVEHVRRLLAEHGTILRHTVVVTILLLRDAETILWMTNDVVTDAAGGDIKPSDSIRISVKARGAEILFDRSGDIHDKKEVHPHAHVLVCSWQMYSFLESNLRLRKSLSFCTSVDVCNSTRKDLEYQPSYRQTKLLHVPI